MNRRKQEWKLYWECTVGEKSHLNIAGKVVFFPAACLIAVVYFGLDLLFSKSE